MLILSLADPRPFFPAEGTCEFYWQSADRIVQQLEARRETFGAVPWDIGHHIDRWRLVRAYHWAAWWVTWTYPAHYTTEEIARSRWEWAHVAWRIKETLATQ